MWTKERTNQNHKDELKLRRTNWNPQLSLKVSNLNAPDHLQEKRTAFASEVQLTYNSEKCWPSRELESWPSWQAFPLFSLTFRMSNNGPSASLLSAGSCAKCLLGPQLTQKYREGNSWKLSSNSAKLTKYRAATDRVQAGRRTSERIPAGI